MVGRTKIERRKIREKNWRERINNWQLYVMLLPAVIWIFLFAYKPMYGALIAFKDYKMKIGIMGSEWVGFKHFEKLFDSFWTPIIIKNTLGISIMSLVIGFPLPIIVALMLNELKNNRYKHLVQTVSYAPHFISTVVICGMVTLFLSPSSGVINAIIEGLGGEKIYFLRDPQYFKWVYVLSGQWQGLGWATIIYTAALSSVDESLLDAAEIDGANRFQKIRYINVPTILPTIVITFILQCGGLLNVGYEKVYLLQADTNLRASEVISTYVYKVGLIDRNYSFSAAAGLLNSAVNSIILLGANWLSKRVTNSSLF